MFLSTNLALPYALLAIFLYAVAKLTLTKWHNVREARKRGCLPPPAARDRGLWGIKTLRESIAATKAGWGPQFMHDAINEVGKDVHTVHAPIFDYVLLITRDVENVKAIFNTNAADWDIGPHRERTFKSAFGLGVMTSRQKDHTHSRGLLRPQFARTNIANLPMFEKHFQCMMKKLVCGQDSWTSKVDLQPIFQNFTLDAATEFLYGQSVYSQDAAERGKLAMSWDPKAPDVASFGQHLDEVKHILDRQGALAKYSWLVNSKTYSQHVKSLQDFVDYFVQRALQRSEKNVEPSNDMVDKYVLLTELVKHTRDPLELRSETLNVLHASRDTTAALMGWVIYFLARDPYVFQKLRSEVLSIYPQGTDPNNIIFERIHKMPYMTQVINETIRMVGIVPMNERAALRDTTLPQGGGPDGMSPIFVPKGRQVLIPTYSMQHREDIWGPDVDDFNPARWEGRQHSWAHIPFGGGVRQCLGQQFAKTETIYVVIRLLQTFDAVENLEGPGPLNFHHTIENRSGTGVQVRLHNASQAALAMLHDNSDFEVPRRESVCD